jgi:hypothetical protein
MFISVPTLYDEKEQKVTDVNRHDHISKSLGANDRQLFVLSHVKRKIHLS